MNRKLWIFIIALVVLIGVGVYYFNYISGKGVYYFSPDTINQNSDPAIVKSVVKQGEFSSETFNINNGDTKQDYHISVQGLENLATISEPDFSLTAEESKELQINFNASADPGAYVGSISIKNSRETKNVIIILEIESQEQLFGVTLDVSPDYKEIKTSGKTQTSIGFINLNDTIEHVVEVNYIIKDLTNNIVVFKNESLSLGARTSVIKAIVLPSTVKPGQYIYIVSVKYASSIATASYLFSVISSGFKFSFDFTTWIVILIVLVFILILYILYERNKIVSELEGHHRSDLKFYNDSIEKQKSQAMNRARNEKEKKRILEDFESAKKKIISDIKKEQEKQKQELDRLKKENKEEEMKQKVKSWNKQGYRDVVKRSGIDNELKNKLGALEDARLAGLISQDSYNKGKRRITRLVKE